MQLTQPEFIRLLQYVAKDDVGALRRACQLGKQQLEARGWRHRDSIAASPPPQLPASAPKAQADRIGLRSSGITKPMPRALAKVRAQMLENPDAEPADETHSRISHLKL